MTNERVSPSARLRAQSVAEREVQRFAGDHARWHKHVHNVDLDSMQLLKMHQMDEHPMTVDFSCRRTGKTATKELWDLEYLACQADQELGIVAPREAQAQVNLRMHLDAIRRSPILDAFMMYDRGRKQFSETRFQFSNRSVAASYGIMAQVDGGDMTIASLEEVDDMPADRLYSRFLLMLGSNRRLGASTTFVKKPRIRITGVFKGADTLDDMVKSGAYHVLPTVDVYLGMEMGIVNEAFMVQMRSMLAAEEYIRQLLCKNVAARNLIWEKWIRGAIQLGIKIATQIVEPVPGAQYKRRGLISFGYDAGGHGEDPGASQHGLVVIEEIYNYKVVIFAKKWKPGADDAVVKDDLKSFWRYFRPDYAMGDAYGVGMLTALNDELYRENLTTVDRRTIGDGDSTASTWREWAFQPIRFEGMVKHQMATVAAADFKNGRVAMPYLDDLPEDINPAVADMLDLQRQLPNIRALPTTKPYASYERATKKIGDKPLGDDLFDAYLAASHALTTRGTGDVPTFVRMRQQTEAELLGQTLEIQA